MGYHHLDLSPACWGDAEQLDELLVRLASAANLNVITIEDDGDLDVDQVTALAADLRPGQMGYIVIGADAEIDALPMYVDEAESLVRAVAAALDQFAGERGRGFALGTTYYGADEEQDEGDEGDEGDQHDEGDDDEESWDEDDLEKEDLDEDDDDENDSVDAEAEDDRRMVVAVVKLVRLSRMAIAAK